MASWLSRITLRNERLLAVSIAFCLTARSADAHSAPITLLPPGGVRRCRWVADDRRLFLVPADPWAGEDPDCPMLIAIDLPFLRGPVARMIAWGERKVLEMVAVWEAISSRLRPNR